MVNESKKPVMPHRCGSHCLAPLTFHPQAVGNRISLSEGCRRAERARDTFKDGVVFSNRCVKANERIQVLVQNSVPYWNGAMRVGFTNVPPSAQSLPLPPMAIPNLTKTQIHWASPLHESCCQDGALVEFWYSKYGYLYVKYENTNKQKLLVKVDRRERLWFMIDVYGQTSSIFLLGSKIKEFPFNRRSCAAPEPLTRPPCSFNPDYMALGKWSDDCISRLSMEIPTDNGCVVCMVREADIALPCGHRCLCPCCTPRVLEQFGTCPLCRLEINSELVMMR